jgi:phage replication O-like protein O
MLNKINHTQLSNDFIDTYMKRLSAAAVKVFVAISRKTIGWHKDIDRISQGQLVELCGLSINTIKAAIKELKLYEIIKVSRTGTGKEIKTYFEINYKSEANVSKIDILSKDFISEIDTLDLDNVSKIDTTKESNINKEYKEIYKKPAAVSTDTELFHAIKDSFEAKGEITDYPKEMKHVKLLCKKLEKKPMEYAQAVIETFYHLVETGNDFWKSQPFLPSVLNSLFDRVNLQVKKKEKVNDVSWYEEYTKEVI